MTVLRPAAVAGMFYPADAAELSRQIATFLAAAPPAEAGAPVPKMLIAPHAGYVYSGPVAAHAYALLTAARGRISRVVLMGPSHRVAFRGIATSGADVWTTPLGEVAIDRDMVARLMALPMVGELDKAHAMEHSLEVHVPFLQTTLGDFQLVPLVAGETPRDMVAAVLDAAWGGPETLIVVSTDLSHYLDYDQCRATDAATVTAIEAMNPDAIGSSQACGRVPVGGALLAARRRGLSIKTLDVRNSGDTAGPRDKVVGYGAWALYEPKGDPMDHIGPKLLDLAWASIRARLDNKPAPKPDDPALARPGACFVTLKRGGNLRGCIGSPLAWRPLGEDVVDNAVKAAFADPRFPPLSAAELDPLTLSVSVLTPPVPMRFESEMDLLGQLRPGIDGLIIEDGGRRALFLPSVWEQLPDPAQFLAHLKHKAGMAIDHWSAHFKASRFQAVEVKQQGD
ncbi:AmmeMemoRadiSam system protein B [Magnetospirillum aberrantis]|uniref:MEMO1 family protein G4223_10230 n=1 Tax=Magnetospirillum aberrantis SpK TaxID=908842 RepID=A0A7C9QTZ4_9PROT|nr:AmmeMemoRadiSam system protein B [Magnetospirillum aberrantis]NFV80485.1 AmmeMemoRadiSam system protein B [Magnetospirillum aberrantis SpK]